MSREPREPQGPTNEPVQEQGLSKEQQLYAYRARPDGTLLTNDQGVLIPHTDDSLKAGERGPTLMEDFHFREKITHFDHERIPERVVHARGSAAHGYFEVYESLAEITKASFLQDPSKQTPVFVRFSQVLGDRGSADTVRDVRGFATKFYTDEGNFDLVGNNIPVFFIQDAIKFPDLIHAGRPEPHHEMPQASTAHDNFYDFISLTPESAHMIMWVLSDRAIPRSYRMMEGFGVHTFRLVNAEGVARFVKFHWKPKLGVHSLVWDEAQILSGKDPDFLRRDLWEAIQQGDYPEWELGLQLLDEADEFKYPFDVLDATKIWPEELVPVRRVGRLVLNRNPDNFFAETEQVAFHLGNLVPGIDVTDDPLLQGRLFSYLDTQLIRLGGPNFHEIPINKSVVPVRNNQRDGWHRDQIDQGRTNYFPNTLGAGYPRLAPADEAYVNYPARVEGNKVRLRSERFRDYFSQATLFWNSMSEPEKRHLIDAARFEIGRCEMPLIRQRMVALLDRIDRELATRVAERVGVQPPTGDGVQVADASGVVFHRVEPPPPNGVWVDASAALSQLNTPHDSVQSRRVAMLIANGVDGQQVLAIKTALEAAGAHPDIISISLNNVTAADGSQLPVDKTSQTAASVLYDAVYIPGGRANVDTLQQLDEVGRFLREAYAHGKVIGLTGEAVELLPAVAPSDGLLAGDGQRAQQQPLAMMGVLAQPDASALDSFAQQFIQAIAQHRFPEREGARGGVGTSRAAG
jgi:catalase